jgi:hypothetical protein
VVSGGVRRALSPASDLESHVLVSDGSRRVPVRWPR